MPSPGDHKPFPSTGPNCSWRVMPVGQRLAGISPGGTDVDHRLGTAASECREQRVLPSGGPASIRFVGPHGNSVNHPSQHPGGVDEMRLGLGLHGLPAVKRHRRFQTKRDMGVRAKEHQSQSPTLQATREAPPFDSSRGRVLAASRRPWETNLRGPEDHAWSRNLRRGSGRAGDNKVSSRRKSEDRDCASVVRPRSESSLLQDEIQSGLRLVALLWSFRRRRGLHCWYRDRGHTTRHQIRCRTHSLPLAPGSGPRSAWARRQTRARTARAHHPWSRGGRRLGKRSTMTGWISRLAG